MQIQPEKQNETCETDSDLSDVQLPLRSLTSQSRQSQARKQVHLTYDGELAEPLPVEPSSDIDDQTGIERLVKLLIQALVLAVWLVMGLLLLHFFPGTPVFTFVVVYTAGIVVSIFTGYGVVLLYDSQLNPYGFNYDQTAQALYWDAVWSLCRVIMWAAFSLLVLLLRLFGSEENYHDWYYQRYRRY
jgi:hypothetical protein